MNDTLRPIGVILFEGADLMDMSGPADVFATARRRCGSPYSIEYLSPAGGMVSTWQGVRMDTAPLASISGKPMDTVLVTGGLIDDSNCDQRIVAWLRENHHFARRIGSVCTGAFMLASAGLLAGRPATTHWEDCDILQTRFPDIEVEANKIFVRDGRIWTSAGITAGIDMALAMVEEDCGREAALAVARNLVVFLKRPGGQSQFSTHLETQAMEGPLTPLLKWIVENPGADLRTEALADKANMSVRTLYRAFEGATGAPPAEWVEAVRLGIAKRLLEQTDARIDQVARNAGFVSYERMRRSFARRLGVTPAEYRERFAHPSPRTGSAIDLAVLHEAFGLVGGGQPTLQ